MKIWITGANGMLAGHFIQLLTQRKIDHVLTTKNQLDILSRKSVSTFIQEQKPTHIINCAAYTQVDNAEKELARALETNLVGPIHLAALSDEYGIPLVHFSSDYVFDGKRALPFPEDHPHSPLNNYGYSKSEGEKALLERAKLGCVIRTSWLFGLSGKNFVDTMVKLMQEKETLRIVSDQVGRPTYCKDLAEATLKLIGQTGVFHFANSNETSWYAFAKEIHRQGLELGYRFKTKEIIPITTKDYPTPAQRPAYSTLSTTKIEKTLGIVPRPWEEALTDYLKEAKR